MPGANARHVRRGGQRTRRAVTQRENPDVQATPLPKALVLAKAQVALLPLGRATPRQALAAVVAQLPDIVAQVLAEGTPLEIADLRVQTRVIDQCVTAAKLGLEAQQTAAEAWLRLERRLGE